MFNYVLDETTDDIPKLEVDAVFGAPSLEQKVECITQ